MLTSIESPHGRSLLALTAAFALLIGAPALAQPRDGANDAQQPIQARPGGPDNGPGSEKTVDVVKGTRLVLSNQAGEVVVRSWDQDRVRIQANHGSRETISAETTDNTLRIRTQRASGSRGPGGLVDYQITVPRWMPVNLTGTYLDATIEGTAAEVTVETVHGNARVTGGNGNVSLRSVEGVITVDKANGRVQATTVNEGIRVTNSSGEIMAETTNGDIFVDNAQTSNLEAYTVNGEVTFNGTIRDSGVYKLGTHNGDIRVGLGGASNATVFVRTFQGDFRADFPVQLPEGQKANSGSKRFNFTLGKGSARIELQSFGGDITLARQSITSRAEERRQRRQSPQAAPQPPQPPQPPGAAPTPKPPKPPGFDGVWDVEQWAEEWAADFSAQFETQFESFGEDFEKSFEADFEKNFEKTLEQHFGNIGKNVERALDNVFKKQF